MSRLLTDRRYREIQAEWQAGREPTRSLAEAAMDRFWEPLIRAEAYTGAWPHVLRFPRPANDIEAAVQHFAFTYTLEQVARPVLLEYYDDPTSPYVTPPPRRSPAQRRASVSARAAWREARRALLRRRQLRLVKG
jgi:hypothetical protein